MSNTMKVLQWNVLTTAFYDKKEYPTYPEEDFATGRKNEQVIEVVRDSMKEKAVIVLQEVCDLLRRDLAILSSEMGYTMKDAAYGGSFTSNMGICMFWPNSFIVEDYLQYVVGQHIKPDKNDRKCKSTCAWPLSYIWGKREKNSWDNAIWRKNVLMIATLRDPTAKRSFVLAGYHMPCTYKEPKIMDYHIQTIWDLIRIDDMNDRMIPLIFAADLNSKPGSSVYKFLERKGMVSANLFEEIEPEFTTNIVTERNPDGFKETLDYVFVTKDLIKEVESTLPAQYESEVLIPNAEFPSDHLWLKFDLTFQ